MRNIYQYPMCLLLLQLMLLTSCKAMSQDENSDSFAADSCMTDSLAADTLAPSLYYDALSGEEIPMFTYSAHGHDYLLADITDSLVMYKTDVNRQNCFVVASKREYRMYVYEVVQRIADSLTMRTMPDTILVAHFPICYAAKIAKKTRSGDGCTPESTMEHPCIINTIEPSSRWDHDFGDGRGTLYPYGPWFMRLKLPDSDNNHIGIHGCTTNEESIPGRDSEGCIRMRDDDLCTFKQTYAQRKQKLIIKSYEEVKYPFEVRAQQALGERYVAPLMGNPYRQSLENE